jgi:hypothetical protein
MKYLYFGGILAVLVALVISLNLFEMFGSLLIVLALMLLTGLVLRYNNYARDLGWGIVAAVVAFTVFVIGFLIWAGFKITC